MSEEVIEAESVETPGAIPFKRAKDVLAYYQMRMRVPKDQRNDYAKYDYRNMEGVNDAFKKVQTELWERYGVLTSLRFPTDELRVVDGSLMRHVTVKLDTPFGTIDGEMTVREPEAQGGMSPSQISGSASSYAKKYAASDLFALGGEKDPDELPPATENQYPTGTFDVRCRRCGNTGHDFTAEAAMRERCVTCGAVDWEVVG